MIIKAAIVLYLIPLFCFYTIFVFGEDYYDWVYYIWDKGAGGSVISWYAIYYCTKKYRPQVAAIFAFSFIRFVWDIISRLTEISAQNNGTVALLFVVLTIVTGYICFHPDNKFTKFLIKII